MKGVPEVLDKIVTVNKLPRHRKTPVTYRVELLVFDWVNYKLNGRLF